MSDPTPSSLRGWLALGAVTAGVFALGLMAASILERRHESITPSQPMVAIGLYEPDSAKWGQNFPRQYGSYRQMDESSSLTKYAGAAPRDLLVETPANVILFAGYAFAKDYNQARGHTRAVEDINHTKRINNPDGTMGDKAPATCWTCKSPDVPRLIHEMGGPEKFYEGKAKDLQAQVTHPIGCADCHDEKTMALVITRPALREAWAAQGKDIAKASHQEMRSLVCAQCHVEYYFKKEPKNYLAFPWKNGMKVEAIEKTYDDNGHVDWVHAISKTPMIKMQHPDYEIYSQGIHAYRNVSCADCHMPYKSEGASKFTDHHLQSPLLNIANSCNVCHRWSETEVRTRVYDIQDKVREGRDRAEAAIAKAHLDVAAAMQAKATDEELKPLRELLRRAQLRWDYVAANNGMGFHAPQECQRILAGANDLAQEVRVGAARLLATKGITAPIAYPDFSSKEKAQALIKQFIDNTPPSLLGK